MNLRPYQTQAINQINEAWNSHANVMLQMPTGGGKTVVFVSIIRQYLKQDKRVMLIAHRQELIDQAAQTLYRNKIYAGIIKSGYPVNYSLPCQVASIQTLARRKELPKSDLIIFDEAHHFQDDNTYGQVLKDFYSGSKVLGVTATPYRLSGEGFTSIFEKLITSLGYPELRDEGFLAPYKYLVGSMPDLEGVKLSAGDYILKDAENAMTLAPLVESYFEHVNGKKGLVFAVNVSHSLKVCEQYNEAGIAAAHVDGTTPDIERRQIFKKFRNGDIKILVNVGITTEGTDIPDADFVQLARPTKSLSLYLQMVGRCFRVPQQVIEGIESAGARRQAIIESEKPYAVILDNAGCWEEHGLPDQKFNWQTMFEGISRREKKEATEMIELVEFIAIDDNGVKVKTKIPKEIEGMKLVEVNKQIRERSFTLTSLKEFDKMFAQHQQIRQIKKKGWTTFFTFQKYCEKHYIDMSKEVWEYLIKKLNDEPLKELGAARKYFEKTLEYIKNDYKDNPSTLIAGLNQQHKTRVARANACYVPKAALKKMWSKYDKSKTTTPKLTAEI